MEDPDFFIALTNERFRRLFTICRLCITEKKNYAVLDDPSCACIKNSMDNVIITYHQLSECHDIYRQSVDVSLVHIK